MFSAIITLTFFPDLILGSLNLIPNQIIVFLLQILGALYFGFGMLNWMNKGRPIGGIYNRPVAIANLSHCRIGLAKRTYFLSRTPISNLGNRNHLYSFLVCIWSHILQASNQR
tara:strand:+ start:969 stop:1307 length:339 start_codon:yes stop_codon:yes gene_type:complete